MYFNVKATSLLDYAEIKMNMNMEGPHGHCNFNLQSALRRFQILLSPDAVVEFPIQHFKRTIGLVSILDNERLWRFIIELSDKS